MFPAGTAEKTESGAEQKETQASRAESPPSASIHAKNHQPGEGVGGAATKQVVKERSLPTGSPPPVSSREGKPPLKGKTSAKTSARTSPIPVDQIKPGPPRFNRLGKQIPSKPLPATPSGTDRSGESRPAPPPRTTSANRTPPPMPTQPKPQKRTQRGNLIPTKHLPAPPSGKKKAGSPKNGRSKIYSRRT